MILNFEPIFWPAYLVFFSALIVSLRSDLETLYISRYVTLYLIPIPFLLSIFELLPINLFQSVLGSLFGYYSLWIVSQIFIYWKNKDGIGEGDFELLAMIGAFTGPIGTWITIFIASLLGSLVALIMYFLGKVDKSTEIPFGPMIATGGFIYAFFQNQIIQYFFG